MFARPKKVRIETERMTLRPPMHGDYRAWAGPSGRQPGLPDTLGTDMGGRSPDP